MKTKFLLGSVICGVIASTMFIGDVFFNAKFGYIPFSFLLLQMLFLILMLNTDEE
jgi:hypothetical protein